MHIVYSYLQLKSYNCEIADSKCKMEILTNQLTEKSAEIEMLKNNERKSSKELESLQIKEEEHTIVINNYKNCFIDLCNFVKSSVDVSDGIMGKFNKGMLSLKALESRVNFAKERLRTIEGRFFCRINWYFRVVSFALHLQFELRMDTAQSAQVSIRFAALPSSLITLF